MSSDSNAASPAVEIDDGRPSIYRSIRAVLKYSIVVIALVSWFGIQPLRFSFREIADWLPTVYLACLLALFFLFLGDLLFRRWRAVAIFVAIWVVVLLPCYEIIQVPRWLYVEAFRRHAASIEGYLSRCKLIEFDQDGAKQNVGLCERLPFPDNDKLTIIYDTTGQLVLPVAQRTPAWTKALVRFSPGRFLTESEGYARHLYGNYYEIYVPMEMMDGSADEY